MIMVICEKDRIWRAISGPSRPNIMDPTRSWPTSTNSYSSISV